MILCKIYQNKMNKKYIILPAAKINEMDFNEICETAIGTIRYNLDSSQFIVKFQGNTPEFLDGYDEYTNSEMLEIINNPSNGWEENEE